MTRLLISIGCNEYEYLDELDGAEQDAKNIFELMTGPDGDYDRDASRLLLSPSHAELMVALDEVLFSHPHIDVFTIFFAGHGGVKYGNYYLCVSDTHPDKLSSNGLALVNLFTMISEKRPQQANVIMDACQSGGAMQDTASLMKPDIVGDVNSLSISFLAACASSQYASEENRAGVATTEILKYLSGREMIQDTRPYLDLVEVGRAVSEAIQQKGFDQTPVTWGLNLYGQARFAKNPHFASGSRAEFPTFIESVVPASAVGEKIRKYSEALWAAYRQVTTEPAYRPLVNLLSTVCADLESNSESCTPFIRGVATSLSTRASSSADLLAESDVMACCALALLPLAQDGEKQALIRDFVREWSLFNEQARSSLDESLKANRFALLNTAMAPSDFYYLPIRVSKVLGWLASEVIIDDALNNIDRGKNDSIRSLAESVISLYSGSLTAMSDEQAPYIYLFAKACRLSGWDDLMVVVLNKMFESFISVEGAVAKAELEPGRAFNYTIARSYEQPAIEIVNIAQPSQLLASLMLCGMGSSIAAEWDSRLIQLDHKTTNIFIPGSYLDFGAEVIYEGTNNTFRIGHDVWSIEDLERLFETSCRPRIEDNGLIQLPEVRVVSILASYLFPNRLPYFLEIP
jgi:Caspase domain